VASPAACTVKKLQGQVNPVTAKNGYCSTNEKHGKWLLEPVPFSINIPALLQAGSCHPHFKGIAKTLVQMDKKMKSI
jgi:hypothetical protein